MNIAAVAHLPLYIDDQRRAFARHAPAADFVAVIPKGWGPMRSYCQHHGIPWKMSPYGGYLQTVNWLAETATTPTCVVEWDVVPIRPVVFEAACSYRGKQHASVAAPPRRFWYPNVLILDPAVDRYEPSRPFGGPFRELEHRVVEGHAVGLPQCCEAAGFSLIGDEFVHHLHGGHRTAERSECWREVMRAVCPPGLGDMVAAGLAAVGITPERVSALTGKPCGCKERQRRLNELGRKVGLG